MTGSMFSSPGLHFILDATSEEIIVYCSGQITRKSAHWFEQEIRTRVIATSGGQVAVNSRIMLDLSDVFHIDNAGLRSLFAIWKAAQQASCRVEIHNFVVRSRSSASARLARRVIAHIRSILWNRRTGGTVAGKTERQRQAGSVLQ